MSLFRLQIIPFILFLIAGTNTFAQTTTPIKYGYLYNWYAVNDERKIAPDGWHIPSTIEINDMISYAGGVWDACRKLKCTGEEFWDYNQNSTNELGFNATGSGMRDPLGNFYDYHISSSFFSSDNSLDESYAYLFRIAGAGSSCGNSSSNISYRKSGQTVRLIKEFTSLSHGQSGTMVGNDGKTYRTICIGTQEWLADNLAETKYRNGDPIPNVTDNTTWAGLTTGARCAYNNNESNVLLRAIQITSQPSEVLVCSNINVTFSITATGAVNYLWRYTTDNGQTWTTINSGSSLTSISFVATSDMNGRKYQCVLTGEGSSTLNSEIVSLTVGSTPSAPTLLQNVSVLEGSKATFPAGVSDAGTYKWEVSSDNGNSWSVINSATEASYTTDATTNSMNGYLYRCKLVNDCGESAPSTSATLTVTPLSEVTPIKYGYLYNWYAVTDFRTISSNDEWIIPNQEQWNILTFYLGGILTAGGQLKDINPSFWDSPNVGASNSAGFNARGAGHRKFDGSYSRIKTGTAFHGELINNFIYYFELSNDGEYAYFNGVDATYALANSKDGFSIRLVKVSTSLKNGQSGTYIGNDGKVYRTICIGTQEWLADNLAETQYRNGNPIPNVTDNTTWAGLNTGSRCAYNNDEGNVLIQNNPVITGGYSHIQNPTLCQNGKIEVSISNSGATAYNAVPEIEFSGITVQNVEIWHSNSYQSVNYTVTGNKITFPADWGDGATNPGFGDADEDVTADDLEAGATVKFFITYTLNNANASCSNSFSNSVSIIGKSTYTSQNNTTPTTVEIFSWTATENGTASAVTPTAIASGHSQRFNFTPIIGQTDYPASSDNFNCTGLSVELAVPDGFVLASNSNPTYLPEGGSVPITIGAVQNPTTKVITLTGGGSNGTYAVSLDLVCDETQSSGTKDISWKLIRTQTIESNTVTANILCLNQTIQADFSCEGTIPQVYDDNLEIKTIVPTQTMNVCGDEAEYKILFKNLNSSATIDEINCTVNVPAGIRVNESSIQAIVVNGSTIPFQIINPNPLQIKLPLTNGLSFNQVVKLTYRASAGCDIIPVRQQGQSATELNVNNNISCSYNIYGSPVIFMHNGSSVVETNSYNIKYADLVMPISTEEQSLRSYRYQVLERKIPVINTTGSGSAGEVRVYVSRDATNLDLIETNIAAINENEEEISQFIPILPATSDPNNYIFTIDAAILTQLGLGNLLDGGEGFVIKEKVKVKSCSNTIATNYKAQWGCNSSICNADAVASANASTTVYLVVEKGKATLSSTFDPVVRPTFLSSNGSFIWTINNTSIEDINCGFSINPFGWKSDFTISSVKLSTDNGNSFTINVPFSQNNGGFWISFNLASDPDGSGGLSDIDKDGYFDDLPARSNVKFLIEYSIPLCPQSCVGYNANIQAYSHVYDACGIDNTPNLGILRDYEQSYTPSGNTTIDLIKGQPFNFTFNPRVTVYQEQLKAIPDLREYYVELTVPNGVVLASNSNPKFNSTSIIASQVGNTIILTGGGANGVYSVNLDLDCSSNSQNGVIDLNWKLKYKATYNDGSENNTCTRDIACITKQTYAHFNCDNSNIITLNSSNGFLLQRNSFGWTRTGHTGNWYKSDLTDDKKVNKDTPNVTLDKAMPYDEIVAYINGHIDLSNCNPDELHAKITYTSPNSNNYFDFTGAVFTMAGNDYTFNSENTERYSITNTTGNDWELDFILPESLVGSFTTSDVSVKVLLKLKDIATTNLFTFNNLRGGFVLKEGMNVLAEENYGRSFSYCRPNTYVSFGFNQTLISVALNGYIGSGFNNEYRPTTHYENLWVEIPAGREIDKILDFSNQPMNNSYYSIDNNIIKFNSNLLPLLDNNYNYIYIYLKVNCASENVTTTNNTATFTLFDHTYLNANSTGSGPVPSQTTSANFNFSINKPTLSLWLESNQPGILNKAVWNTRLENKSSNNSTYTWIAYEPDANNVGDIMLTKVYNADGSEIPYDATGASTTFPNYIRYGTNNQNILVKIGNVAYLVIKEVRLEAEYSNCVNGAVDKINVFAGWDPLSYPTSPATYPCNPITGSLTLTHKTANLQWEVNQVNEGPFNLCDVVNYQVVLNSTGLATMYDINASLELPHDATLVSDITATYNGANYTIPRGDGTTYSWDLKNFISSLTNGFPSGKSVVLNFQVKPECKFDPGSIIKFGASGITNCGVTIPYTYSTRIPINGVNIIDNFKVELNDVNIYQRNAGGLVYVKVKNLGEITSRPQNVEVRLSPEFDYVVNSSSDVTGEPISHTSLDDGTEILLWKNFPIINPGDYLEFTFRILDHVECPVNQGVISASCFIDLNLLPTCPGSELCTDRATLTSDSKAVKIPFIVPGRISQVIGTTSVLKGSTMNYSCSKSSYSTGYVWSLTEGAGELQQNGQNVTLQLNPTFVGECQLSVHGVNTCTDGSNTTITINVLDILPSTGSISGSTEVCLNTSQLYTVAITPGATIYKWQLPTGAEIISYPKENVVELRFTETGTNIPLSVTASNPVAGDSPQPTTILVNVRALPDASFTGFNAEHRYCKSDNPITLTPTTSGGTFKYAPIVNAGDANKFYPSVADVGIHTIEYSIEIDGCAATTKQTVEVTAPAVSFVNLSDNYCHVNEEIDIISTPTEGGIYKYYIDGQQIGGNNESLKINPSLLSVGSHIVKFEFTSSASGCTNYIEKTINIRALPQVQISSSEPNGVCFGEEVRLTANVVNGSWPFTLNWNYATGKKKLNYLEFNVEQNTTVGLTVTDKYGCAAAATANVVVLPKPNIIVENVLAVSCPTTSDGEIKFNVDYQNGAPGDILKYTIKPHNFASGAINNIEITPNQSVQFTDFSLGFQNIKVESSNGCSDIESVNIENGGPVIDICPEAILCTYNNVDPAGIRVKVNVTSKRFQNLAGSNYSYTIEGRDVNYSGSGQYGVENWTNPITVKPGRRYKFKLQQSGTTCNVAPVEFTARAASILLNIDNGKSIYPKCDEDDKISVRVSASVTQGCMSTVSGDLNYRLQRKDANGNLSVVSGYNWAPAAADNSFSFTDLTLAGEYLVETKYKGNDGCSNPIWFKILDPQVLNIETSVKDASCFGMADGNCSVYVTGNSLPLEYKWYRTNDPEATAISNTATCYGLRAGSYSVDITVLSGCTNNKYTRTLVVGQPTQIEIPTISWLPADPCLPWAETSGGTASYTFNWYKLTEAGMLSEAVQNMFSGLGNFFGNTNTIFGTTKELVYSDHVDIPKSQPEKNTIKPGKYIIEVVDGNGCVRAMPESYKYDPRPGDRTYNIAFRWRGYVTKIDSGDDIVIDNLEATQAQQELEENMLACIKARLAELQATYKDYCKKPDKLNDKVSLTQTPVSGSYNMGYYTLYYYDRAGNLIRTVAPKDVVFYNKDVNGSVPVVHNVTTEYSYNSLGQLVYQKTPDANESRFIYNNKGQLRFSQNAEQASTENGKKEQFSYTRYDELGRVIEVGECTLDQPMAYTYKLAGVDKSASVTTFNDLTAIADLDDNTFSSSDGITESYRFPVIANHYNQLSSRTVTIYSTPDPTVKYQRKGQRYLLNRVSYTYTVLQRANEYANGTNLKARELRSSTYYSYDPHGNVEWVVQEQPGVGRSNIAYQYDLISNKVRKVLMNHKRPDAYYHQYEYDEDNRLLSTYTSENNRIWDRDANYLYFEHGPLKRVELGQDRIQGIDYAYTLQGWLKAINSPDLEEVVAGEDEGFAKDRFGMVLGYHEDDFYRTNSTRFTNSDSYSLKPMEDGAKRRNLYNGNISSWVSSYLNNNNIKDISGYQYKYDILNRIKGAQFNTFSTTFNPVDQYGTSYSYDLNGNITNLTRNGNLGADKVQMDNLTYNYEANTNKLTSVADAIDEVDRYADDIDSQSLNNYRYDKVGNLVRDSLAGISIKWNVYGKVAEVVPDKNETKQKPHIIYTYDAAGNRVSKQVNKKPAFDTQGKITTEITDPEAVKNTYYLRDASGNTMAVYERSNRKVSETYEAVYTLGEVSLYGSDRLGTFTPDINSPLAILPFTTAADYFRVSLNLDEVLGRLPGTQTFVASSYSTSAQTTDDKSTFVAVKSQLNRAMYNEVNNDYLLSENIAEFDGNLATHAAIGEDENGIPQFYIVPGSNMVFGSNNPLMVYNTAGALMSNTDNLNYLTGTKVQVSKVKGGEGKFYMIFTVGTDGKIYYHVVDMALENGLGNIAVKNQPLLAETNHTDVPLAVEDPDQGKLFVFVSRSISEGNIEVWKVELNGLTETMELAKGPLAETELRLASYGIISMGINPDADRMLVYHHTTKPDITNDATAQLVVYPLALNLLPDGDALGAQTVGVTNSNSSATYTADGSTILLTINSKGNKQTVSFDMGNGTLTEVLTGTTGNLQLYADGRVYVSGADRGTISGINADLYNDFTMLVNKPLSGMLAQRTVQARVVTSEEQLMARSVGRKEYELKDHLGNVRALVADVKTATTVDGQTKFQTGLLAQYSYYPFGMLQPGRFNPANPMGEGGYRYGFQGQEKDDEWNGIVGSHLNFGARIYDARLAMFFSIDPRWREFPNVSPFVFAANNPINFIDIDGEGPGFAQLYIGTNGELKAQIFTTDDTYLQRHLFNKMVVGMSIKVPTKDPNLEYQVNRHENLANTVHEFVEDNVVAAAPGVGLVITGVDLYANIQRLRYQYKQAEESTKINDVIDTRKSVNLSISTGKWLLDSYAIAEKQGVFSELNLKGLSKNFAIDVANYGMMVLGGRDNLTENQQFFNKPEDMSNDEYGNLVKQAFNALGKSIVQDIENSKDEFKTTQLGGRILNTYLIRGEQRKYPNQPLDASQDYLPKK